MERKTNRKSVCKPKPKSARLSDQDILSCRQAYAEKQKMFKGRTVKIAHDKELMQYIESRIADD